jgi:hypothetical protein
MKTMETLTLSRRPMPYLPSRLGDIVLDVAVPALAALLTMGIFLLAVG